MAIKGTFSSRAPLRAAGAHPAGEPWEPSYHTSKHHLPCDRGPGWRRLSSAASLWPEWMCGTLAIRENPQALSYGCCCLKDPEMMSVAGTVSALLLPQTSPLLHTT